MTTSVTVPAAIQVTPLMVMLQYFDKFFKNFEAKLYNYLGIPIFETNNVTVKVDNNHVTFMFEYTPDSDQCIQAVEIDASLPGSEVEQPILAVIFGTSSPTASPITQLWFRKGVTYLIEITVSYDIPTSTSVPAPTGLCRSGTPVS